jgi:DeoR family transcriptional regulator, glycerol-3-phosphate regulon repressor
MDAKVPSNCGRTMTFICYVGMTEMLDVNMLSCHMHVTSRCYHLCCFQVNEFRDQMNKPGSSSSLRHNEIIALFRLHGFMSMEALAEHFSVTPQTIRRDINALCDADILRRRHGGAELIMASRNQPYDTRSVNNLDAKMRIGEAVARLIPNSCCLLIGIGTTPEQVAHALAQHDFLTVVTNNLRAALALSKNQNNQIIVPGGTLRFPNPEILGPEANQLFRSFRADFGIYSVGGIDTDGALLDFDRTESDSRQALRESCRTQILVADSSKFGRQAPVRGGHLSDPGILVTDLPLAGGFNALRQDDASLIVAGMGA